MAELACLPSLTTSITMNGAAAAIVPSLSQVRLEFPVIALPVSGVPAVKGLAVPL